MTTMEQGWAGDGEVTLESPEPRSTDVNVPVNDLLTVAGYNMADDIQQETHGSPLPLVNHLPASKMLESMRARPKGRWSI